MAFKPVGQQKIMGLFRFTDNPNNITFGLNSNPKLTRNNRTKTNGKASC